MMNHEVVTAAVPPWLALKQLAAALQSPLSPVRRHAIWKYQWRQQVAALIPVHVTPPL